MLGSAAELTKVVVWPGPGSIGRVTRVDWARYSGDDIEAVVAMMVNRERPNSVRITPSRGDGGVDVLDPRTPRGRADDGVLQIKRFAAPLSAGQKAQVLDSLDALVVDPRWATLQVGEWRLVTPWDPTPEALTWLQDQAKARGLVGHWDGLTVVDNLAAKLPEVVDYYPYGGSSRILAAIDALTQLLRGQQKERLATTGSTALLPGATEGPLTPGDVVAELQAMAAALDTDPHYRYDLEVGSGDMPNVLVARPGLVTSVFVGDGQRWAKVDIIARCAASVVERPLTFSLTLRAARGTEQEQQLQDFHTFGRGLDTPVEAANVSIDLPGDLGGDFGEGRVLIWPVQDEDSLGEHPELRAEVLDADDTSLVEVFLIRTERTTGVDGDGVRAAYWEDGGAFTLEWRTLVADMSSTLVINGANLAGLPVNKVLPGVRFASLLKQPHALRLSDRYLSAIGGSVLPIPATTADPAAAPRGAEVTAQLVEALAVIQDHVSEVVLVPDLGATSWTQARGWLAAATLLNGGTLAQPAQELEIGLPGGTPLPSAGARIYVPQPLTIEVGEQRLELGEYYASVDASDVSLSSARSAGASPGDAPPSSSAPVWVRVLAAGGQVILTRQLPSAQANEEPDQAS